MAAEGYAAAVRLLPRLAGRRLGREDAQYWLGRFAGVAADAAACALAAGDAVSAVTLLASARPTGWIGRPRCGSSKEPPLYGAPSEGV